MGTWGEGLYDNDGALDEVGDLFAELELKGGPVAMATMIGLHAWLEAPVSDELADAVRAHPAWVGELPEPARALLELLARDRAAFEAPRARSERLTEVLGGYCDGPRYLALLTLPGGESVIAALAASAVVRLEDGLAASPDLYEAAGPLANLGVLLELHEAGLWKAPAGAVTTWRRALDRIDRETGEERDFWDAYVARARRGLTLLQG